MKFFQNHFYRVFSLVFLGLYGSLNASLWPELQSYEPPEQKKFVFVICSRNNAKWVEQNLRSAFTQDYPRDKFRFIYVDDNSSDETVDLVIKCVTENNEWERFSLIKNQSWQSIMPNHYMAAYLCDDDEIIVHYDGDDLLKHDKVLWFLNRVYNKWDVWLTYGQYENWPNPELGFSIDVPQHIAQQNQFREMGFWYSHPRTFYAWLFKKIKLKDLIWRGSFIPTTPAVDYMFMFPMMEMAGQGHYKFIPDVLYLYNRTNALSTCNMPIKLEIPPAAHWEKYQPLQEKDNTITSKRRNKQANLLLLSFDNPDELTRFITHEVGKIHAIDQITVLYCAQTDENVKKYASLNMQDKNIRAFDINNSFDILNCLNASTS